MTSLNRLVMKIYGIRELTEICRVSCTYQNNQYLNIGMSCAVRKEHHCDAVPASFERFL